MPTRPFILTAKRAWFAVLISALLACALILIGGCREKTEQAGVPNLLRTVTLTDGSEMLQPLRVQVVGDTVFVSYKGIPRLDKYTLDFQRVGRVDLTDPEPVKPSAFAVSDSQIVVADHARGAVVIYDRGGRFVNSFGLLPDAQTRLLPLALSWFQGVAYVADMALKQVLAISTAADSDVSSQGELILQVPGDKGNALGLPSAVFVTPDGRLLVGDAGEGEIRVFTCDGREIYSFDPVPGGGKIAPQGFALDTERDPSLQVENSRDPSGVREMGRIHMVDGRGRRVHMFNPLGKYLASYPDEKTLDGPSDVAIDTANHRVYVADSRAKQIHVFNYGDEE
jgi:sugar lactone lactonase YvrE